MKDLRNCSADQEPQIRSPILEWLATIIPPYFSRFRRSTALVLIKKVLQIPSPNSKLAYRTEKQLLSNCKTLFCRGQANVLNDLSSNLVIILHGFDSAKEDHTYQAMHLASWGMHSLSLQLPNKGPWVGNGQTLAIIVQLIYRWPEIFDNRADVNNKVLVDHSFGGAAVAVALAEGEAATGAILLDPAAISRELPAYLSRIKKPVLILGVDGHVSPARNCDYFYRCIRSGVAQDSIKDAIHEDDQTPSESREATEELQVKL